ncbi:MAG: RNase adapter RapZ [Propionibacteriaceae bacterium]
MEPLAPGAKPRIVIVTGISGGGRRTAAHVLEDLGWYVVDNLPPSMLLPLLDLAQDKGYSHVAVVLDVRSREAFEQLPTVFAEAERMGQKLDVLYLDASDEAIVRRQESARRPLPLQGDGPILDGITKERRMLAMLRASADMVIDTTNLNVHQLQERVAHAYGGTLADELRIAVVSFGFKNGLPVDADMVFDVRFLPNPHWVPELRPQTGLSEPVSSYVLAQPGAQDFLDQLEALFGTVAAGYVNEGKRLVTLAIGCTGGKHRSTAMTEAVATRLRAAGFATRTIHRDLGKE